MIRVIVISSLLLFSCETFKTLNKSKKEGSSVEKSEQNSQTRSYDFSSTDTKDYSIVIEPLDSKVDMTITNEEGKVFKARNARYTRKKTKRVTRNNKIDTTDRNNKIIKYETILEQLRNSEKEMRFRTQIAIIIVLGIVAMFSIGLFMVFKKIKTISELSDKH